VRPPSPALARPERRPERRAPDRAVAPPPRTVDALCEILAGAVRAALELEDPPSPSARTTANGRGHERSADAPDDPATWGDDATRLAEHATAWVGATVEPIGQQVASVMESSGKLLEAAEERGWAALAYAGESGLAALQSARQRLWASRGGDAEQDPVDSANVKSSPGT
jgi:hypothetical protein